MLWTCPKCKNKNFNTKYCTNCAYEPIKQRNKVITLSLTLMITVIIFLAITLINIRQEIPITAFGIQELKSNASLGDYLIEYNNSRFNITAKTLNITISPIILEYYFIHDLCTANDTLLNNNNYLMKQRVCVDFKKELIYDNFKGFVWFNGLNLEAVLLNNETRIIYTCILDEKNQSSNESVSKAEIVCEWAINNLTPADKIDPSLISRFNLTTIPYITNETIASFGNIYNVSNDETNYTIFSFTQNDTIMPFELISYNFTLAQEIFNNCFINPELNYCTNLITNYNYYEESEAIEGEIIIHEEKLSIILFQDNKTIACISDINVQKAIENKNLQNELNKIIETMDWSMKNLNL